ncbi:FMN-binding protein [Shewanella sp. AS16]|uniref:FMN-binding protein n=1 Tax=Shewanella sp. AS16 TaxID=2907625 RepID=UPI001F3950C7|nr:FMN-binding protein [Shewanella sp. AS16]MCE9685727.1 FMN-binding protein [Shewanella sp. AS16]
MTSAFIRTLLLVSGLSATFLCLPVRADVYQSNEDFIAHAFNEAPNPPAAGEPGLTQRIPKPKLLWLTDDNKAVIASILAHDYNKLRLRYWQRGQDTVWILEEIGKESPITVGIHIRDRQIVQTKVLIYRESRGDEVRHDFFTDQFKSARLTQELQLDRHIDGITGATLSVRALTKLSRIALYLNSQIPQT